MKKIWLVGLIIAALALPGMVSAQVETGMGTLQIGGKIKWLYAYQAEDEDAKGVTATGGQVYGFDGMPVELMATTNVELDLAGTIGENVSYLIELSASIIGSNPSNAAGGLVGATSAPMELGTASGIGVRQAKVMFSDVIPMTQVTVGTFNLPLGIYQTRATNDWDLINLPFLNTTGLAVAGQVVGGGGGPMGLGWQATGFDFAVKPMDMVALHLVYFNGQASGSPNSELVSNNMDLEKSGLINLIIGDEAGSMVSIAYLGEGWQQDTDGDNSTEQQNASGYVVSGAYITDKIEVNFDYVTMTAQDLMVDNTGAVNKMDDLTWAAYQLTLGYWVTDAIEVLVRYENVDPNTFNDSENAAGMNVNNTEFDQLTVTTIGMNYRINECAEVALNYMLIEEQGKDIDVDPTVIPNEIPSVDPEYQALDNDTLLIQVQVWQ